MRVITIPGSAVVGSRLGSAGRPGLSGGEGEALCVQFVPRNADKPLRLLCAVVLGQGGHLLCIHIAAGWRERSCLLGDGGNTAQGRGAGLQLHPIPVPTVLHAVQFPLPSRRADLVLPLVSRWSTQSSFLLIISAFSSKPCLGLPAPSSQPRGAYAVTPHSCLLLSRAAWDGIFHCPITSPRGSAFSKALPAPRPHQQTHVLQRSVCTAWAWIRSVHILLFPAPCWNAAAVLLVRTQCRSRVVILRSSLLPLWP